MLELVGVPCLRWLGEGDFLRAVTFKLDAGFLGGERALLSLLPADFLLIFEGLLSFRMDLFLQEIIPNVS